jgi:hypothetical protein
VAQWPPLEDGYTDEFGPVAPDIYAAAGSVWPQAERFAATAIGDSSAGVTLLMQAAAQASRRRAEGGVLRNLRAYVFQSFKRIVLAQVQKEQGHRELEARFLQPLAAQQVLSRALERRILIQELRERMDPWTRQVFEWLVLGHDFNEIGRMLNRSGAGVRNRYRDQLTRLAAEFGAGRERGECRPIQAAPRHLEVR